MGIKGLFDQKPVGETILGKIARDMAMRNAGIDPRTEDEKPKDRRERERAIREFDRCGGDFGDNDVA